MHSRDEYETPTLAARPLAVAQMADLAMRCPECGSEDFLTSAYDHGTDPETGYHDAGVRALCRNCGHQADVEDFQEQEQNNNDR